MNPWPPSPSEPQVILISLMPPFHRPLAVLFTVTEEFWTLSLLVLDFDFDVKFYKNLGSNQATVRYVQTVTTTDGVSVGAPSSTEYPFSYARDQHEHVIATLNDDCEVEKWDQYGDNQEQNDVFDATFAVICVIGASGLPIEECDVTPPDEPEVAQ